MNVLSENSLPISGVERGSQNQERKMNLCSPRIRVKEVAQLLGCSVSTVWSWVRKGYLPPPQRVGRRFSFWLREEIEVLAHSQSHEVR